MYNPLTKILIFNLQTFQGTECNHSYLFETFGFVVFWPQGVEYLNVGCRTVSKRVDVLVRADFKLGLVVRLFSLWSWFVGFWWLRFLLNKFSDGFDASKG